MTREPMSEAEWRTGADPTRMLWFLRDKGSDRKLRLLAVACCRRAWHLMEPHLAIRACVEFAEGYADGVGAKKRLKKLTDENHRQFSRFGERAGEDIAVAFAASAARAACHPKGSDAADVRSVGWALGGTPACDYPAQVALLQDIFGNPFRVLTVDPAWKTFTVLALAKQMYESRDFSAMPILADSCRFLPILADALQDADCANADIIDHCRGEGPHVRGCFVVDLILEKQ